MRYLISYRSEYTRYKLIAIIVLGRNDGRNDIHIRSICFRMKEVLGDTQWTSRASILMGNYGWFIVRVYRNGRRSCQVR